MPGGGGEWTTSLLSPREADATAGGPIPCRRMRSGSYIKAMGDEDSDESGGGPKPSPKTAARRQSYLRAARVAGRAEQSPQVSAQPRPLEVAPCPREPHTRNPGHSEFGSLKGPTPLR